MMQDNLRAMLIKAKVLQMFADIFAVFGIFLFIYIYLTQYQNNPTKALHDPMFIVSILVPFIPAAVLAFVASRKRAKIRQVIEQNNAAKSHTDNK